MQAGVSKQIHSRINDLADSFEDAWLRGETPYIGDYWDASFEGKHREQLFKALLDLELHYTCERRLTISIERLVADFSDYQALIETAWLAQQSRNLETVQATNAASLLSKTENPLAVGQSFGRYQILRDIGRGAMGVVYLAEDTLLERQVAIKIPTRGATEYPVMERLLREASVVAKIHHPNICPVFDVGCHDGIHYISMAFIAGHTLAERMKLQPALTNLDIARIVRSIALALHEVHTIGVVHRDLKPANIMINEGGQPAITDFGLARRMLSASDVNLTHEHLVLGTPAYMSPEQVCDARNVGSSADIYSLGVILYQLICGQLPFQGPMVSVLRNIVDTVPEPPSTHRPDIDLTLEAICLKAMSKSPHDRFGTMLEFANAIDDFLDAPAGAPAPLDKLSVDLSTSPTHQQPLPLTTPSSTPKASHTNNFRFRTLIGLCSLTLLILMGVVILIPSKFGTLVVEIYDPAITVQVNSTGVVIQGEDNQSLKIVAGEDQVLSISLDELTFTTDEFSLSRGEKVLVQIGFANNQIVTKKDGAAWQVFSFPQTDGEPTKAQVGSATLEPDQALLESLAARGLQIHTVSEIPVQDWIAKVDQVSWINLLQMQKIKRSELQAVLRIFPHADRILTNTTALEEDDWSLLQRYDPSELMIASEKIPGPILERIGGMRRLSALGVLGCNITDEQLAQLTQLEHLEYLGLDNNPLDGSGLRHLHRLKKLRNLDLAMTRITDASLVYLAPFTELNAINLANNSLDGSGFSIFQQLPDIRVIILTGTAIRQSALVTLAALPNLRHLSISHCSGLSDLSALANSGLTSIDIRGLSITDLSPLVELPLDKIWVDDPDQLPAELRKNRPQLSVN